ncbi:unnamed protein product [Ectocarpus sp. 12 AP-2014]
MTLLVSVVFQLSVIRISFYCGSALLLLLQRRVSIRSAPLCSEARQGFSFHNCILNVFSKIVDYRRRNIFGNFVFEFDIAVVQIEFGSALHRIVLLLCCK